MTKIKNLTAYNKDTTITDNDFVIGSDGDSIAKTTKNFFFGDIRYFVNAGLAPEVGGTLKISQITYTGILTTPEDVVNALDPNYQILQYHNVFINLNGQVFLLIPQNRLVGINQTPVLNSDFIEFPVSIGPQGIQGEIGPQGIQGEIGPQGIQGEIGPQGIDGVSITNTGTSTIVYGTGTLLDPYIVEVVNLQKEIISNYILESEDNNHTIIINNGTSPITITVNNTIESNGIIYFIQQGTGDVNFNVSGVTINSPGSMTKIKGQNYWACLTKVGSSTVYQLLGSLKA